MSNVDRALRSIGKSNFVEYFEDYKELADSKEKITGNDKMPLAKKLLEKNPNATKLSGQMIRISAALGIFRNGWEEAALKEVMESKHPSITKEIKAKAASLINKRVKI
ncbi:hypothetical protein [Planococcus shenhongbingii]|uniref:HEAT repeat domain-containing protein n=1 Tax=Planococcus shenhongbingii TaxID=3058398 RepID=A0ABT8NGQ7_9BACL|nr:hypothetical protein [Planococcus sp. N017]MDN7247076.1 hypothetical protein [Planococcus sp. N017]